MTHVFRHCAPLAIVVSLFIAMTSAANGATPTGGRPRPGAGYVGTTSQKTAGPSGLFRPVSMRISNDGRMMSRFDLQWIAPCTSPGGRGSFSGLSVTLKKKLSPRGFFFENNTFSSDAGQGNKAVFKVSLVGHFAGRRTAKGTFRISATVADASGAQIDSCDSGLVNWTLFD